MAHPEQGDVGQVLLPEQALHPPTAVASKALLAPNPLQPLLEQAVRESLRELAKSASESSTTSGSSQSIDCIVRSVAARIINEAGSAGEFGRAANPAPLTPTVPLLTDLQTTPWVLWQESSTTPSPYAIGRPGPWSVPRRSTMSEDIPLTCGLSPEEGSQQILNLGGGAPSEETGSDGRSSLSDADEELVLQDAAKAKVPPMALPLNMQCVNNTPKRKPALGASPKGSTPEPPLVITEGLTVESNSDQHLMMHWKGRPGTVLFIAKPGDPVVMTKLQDMAAWLSSQGVVTVFEQQLLDDQPMLKNMLTHVRTFTKLDQLERHIDLVITIGGDGTLTWAVSQFDGPMPPVLSFAAGSLGFLTPFPLDNWVRILTRIFNSQDVPMPLVCRMRLRVVVRRRCHRVSSGNDLAGQTEQASPNCDVMEAHALNEVLIHRGRFGAMAKLDVGVDGQKVTVLQGDGVILATPTGSTAYSLAAGGSMAHPGVPAILLTPVSPHSLSFRPAVLPDSAVVSVAVPLTARCGAALSVDGKDLCFLKLGDSVEVSCSSHPVPTICRTTGTADWFNSVKGGLQWNGRVEQK